MSGGNAAGRRTGGRAGAVATQHGAALSRGGRGDRLQLLGVGRHRATLRATLPHYEQAEEAQRLPARSRQVSAKLE